MGCDFLCEISYLFLEETIDNLFLISDFYTLCLEVFHLLGSLLQGGYETIAFVNTETAEQSESRSSSKMCCI